MPLKLGDLNVSGFLRKLDSLRIQIDQGAETLRLSGFRSGQVRIRPSKSRLSSSSYLEPTLESMSFNSACELGTSLLDLLRRSEVQGDCSIPFGLSWIERLRHWPRKGARRLRYAMQYDRPI